MEKLIANHEIRGVKSANGKAILPGEEFTPDSAKQRDSLLSGTKPAAKLKPADKVESESQDDDKPKGLNDLTIPELKTRAEEEGIDLGGATKKGQIIEVIEAGRKAKADAEAASQNEGGEGGEGGEGSKPGDADQDGNDLV